MGRPTKTGLDYFPMDTTWEKNMRLMRARYRRGRGVGFMTELWKLIYGEKGFFAEWDDEVQLLFADEIGEEVEFVKEAIDFCFEKGMLDRQVFEKHHVLTSHGIQKRYYQIVRELKRSNVPVVDGITYREFSPDVPPGGNPDNPQAKPEIPPGDSTQTERNGTEGKGNGTEREKTPSAAEFTDLIKAAVVGSPLSFGFDEPTLLEIAEALVDSSAPPGYPKFIVDRIEAQNAAKNVAKPRALFRDVVLHPDKYGWLRLCVEAGHQASRASPTKHCRVCGKATVFAASGGIWRCTVCDCDEAGEPFRVVRLGRAHGAD